MRPLSPFNGPSAEIFIYLCSNVAYRQFPEIFIAFSLFYSRIYCALRHFLFLLLVHYKTVLMETAGERGKEEWSPVDKYQIQPTDWMNWLTRNGIVELNSWYESLRRKHGQLDSREIHLRAGLSVIPGWSQSAESDDHTLYVERLVNERYLTFNLEGLFVGHTLKCTFGHLRNVGVTALLPMRDKDHAHCWEYGG